MVSIPSLPGIGVGSGGGLFAGANPIFGLPTIAQATIQSLDKSVTVQADIVMMEKHKYHNLITQNPLDTQEIITDHIVAMPFQLEMKGRISTTPINPISALVATAAGAAGNALGLGALGGPAISIAAGLLSSKSSTSRHITAEGELVRLFAYKFILNVATGLAVYTNMVIEDLEFPREKTDGRSLVFSILFKQILYISSTTGLVSSKVSSAWINGIGVSQGYLTATLAPSI